MVVRTSLWFRTYYGGEHQYAVIRTCYDGQELSHINYEHHYSYHHYGLRTSLWWLDTSYWNGQSFFRTSL